MADLDKLEGEILKLSVLETAQLANLLEQRLGYRNELVLTLREASYSIITAFTGVKYT